MRRALHLVLALALAWPAIASAKKIYKIVDDKGITHYTDRKPPAEVAAEAIPVRAENQPIVSLRLDGNGSERRAVLTNRLAGSIEVELRLGEVDNITTEPALPLRIVIPAASELVAATLRSADPSRPSSFKLEYQAVPGDPAAQPVDDVYLLPLDSSVWRLDQGFGGGFSHTEPGARYAIDLAVDEGTPVLAARAGVVMQVEDDFEGAGLNREKFAARANLVRVQHADGSMGVYAHLQPESVLVVPGARVRVGQRLGASGNTGFSSGPHLHFAVQVNRGMALESVPFELHGPEGRIAIPDETDGTDAPARSKP